MRGKRPVLKHAFNHMTIRLRFTLYVLFAVFITMSLFSAYNLYMKYNNINADLLNKADTTAELAAVGFSDSLWNYNYDGMKSIGTALFKDPEVGSVKVTTNIDRIIYSDTSQGDVYANSGMVHVTKIIMKDDKYLGTVSVGITDYYMKQELEQEVMSTLLTMMVTMAVLWILITFISRRITRPIYALTAGTEEIASGNLSQRLTVESADEIGMLARKFNSMSDQLALMIEQRDKSAQALAASEEKFSTSFRYAADTIGVISLKDQRYIEANDAYFRTFGYVRDEVIGRSSVDFNLWEDPEQRQAIYERLSRQEPIRNIETRWLTKSGEVLIGLTSVDYAEIFGEKCFIFVWHDITARKKAEEELQRLNSELEQKVDMRTRDLLDANEELIAINQELTDVNVRLAGEIEERKKIESQLADANQELTSTIEVLNHTQAQLVQSEKMASLGSLVSGVAHEINTPLGIGIAATSNLQRLTSDFVQRFQAGPIKRQELVDFLEDCQTGLSMICPNLDRAAHLVRSFKQVSIDQSSDTRRLFHICGYLEEILLSLHPVLKKVRQQIDIQCDNELLIDSYPGPIAHIVTTLVQNSLQHAYAPEDEGHIIIRVEEKPGRLLFVYSDDGTGMDEDTLKHIFDPFFTTKRGSGATGLGMSILYNIVTMQLGGHIECFSEPGKGSTFYIDFPL